MAISKVELQGLVQTAQGQQQAIESAQSDLQSVVSECDALGSAWQGEAAMLFQDAMGNFQQGANQVLTSLREMHEKMISTHSQFSDTHNTIGSVARATSGSMTGLHGL